MVYKTLHGKVKIEQKERSNNRGSCSTCGTCRVTVKWHLLYLMWNYYWTSPSIDSFGILFGIFIVLSVHQLTALLSCLVSSLFCRSINWQHLYPVWYLHCFVGLSIDSFVILFGIFIALSIHQLTTLVFCLVSLLFNNEDTKQDTKAVNWWTDKTIKIPNRIPKLSIDEPTKQ
jgi:hypothetical protein